MGYIIRAILMCFNGKNNFRVNVTKFGVPTDFVEIDTSQDLVAMETILVGNYECLSYQKVHIY